MLIVEEPLNLLTEIFLVTFDSLPIFNIHAGILFTG